MAKQADAILVVYPYERKAIDVIEFQVACLRAPSPAFIYEGATPAIALVDLPPDGIGDMSRHSRLRSCG